MTARYSQLQPEDRVTTASLLQQGLSQRAIALLLGRSPSIIFAELARNSCSCSYASKHALASCVGRRTADQPVPKLHPDAALWHLICDLLLWRWSPQQIAHTPRRLNPDAPRASAFRTRRLTTQSMPVPGACSKNS